MPEHIYQTGKATYDYMPALDGMRAFSVFLVVAAHAGLRHVLPGGLGVMIFFAISGFLLTRQMIVEIESRGTLNIPKFYLRRLLRLMPGLALYLTLFCTAAIYLGATITTMQILSGFFYFSNYYYIYGGYGAANPVPITWSLSVEEHYYILFPFLMYAFRKHLITILPVLCALVAAALLWRFYLYFSFLHSSQLAPAVARAWAEDKILFYRTDSIFDCILYGAVFALALHYYNGFTRRLFVNYKAFLIALLILSGTLAIRNPVFRDTLRFSLQSISIAVLIINILFGHGMMERINAMLSQKHIVLLGRMSYSIYLFHFGTLLLMRQMAGIDENLPDARSILWYIGGTLLFSSASYFLVEKPMVRFRKMFGSHSPNKG